jgi:hypothetical protein
MNIHLDQSTFAYIDGKFMQKTKVIDLPLLLKEDYCYVVYLSHYNHHEYCPAEEKEIKKVFKKLSDAIHFCKNCEDYDIQITTIE